MDEGAALLHSLERGVNQGVTSLVAAGMNPEPRSTDDLVLAKQGQEVSVTLLKTRDRMEYRHGGHRPGVLENMLDQNKFRWTYFFHFECVTNE